MLLVVGLSQPPCIIVPKLVAHYSMMIIIYKPRVNHDYIKLYQAKSPCLPRSYGKWKSLYRQDSTSLCTLLESVVHDTRLVHMTTHQKRKRLCNGHDRTTVCLACVSHPFLLSDAVADYLSGISWYLQRSEIFELAFFWMLARFTSSSTCSLQSYAYGTCSRFLWSLTQK